MDFQNTTRLSGSRLLNLFLQHTVPYRHDALCVRVRYSRGADFSGTCYYATQRIFVNLGRNVRYPYLLGTHIARSQSNATHWWRENYKVVIADAYQLVLFVYLHELYHYLVQQARRNTRRKEAMCDRFAVRALVDHHNCPIVDSHSRAVPRHCWDFQDVDAFVAAAPKVTVAPVGMRPVPVRIRGVS